MLNENDVDYIVDTLGSEFQDPNTLYELVSRLNRTGKLEEFLELVNLPSLSAADFFIPKNPVGKILVLGALQVDLSNLKKTIRQSGLKEDRFEFVTDYEQLTNYNVSKLQYNDNYGVILAGPMPHSMAGIDGYSSPVAMMEQEEGFPPIVQLRTGSGELKITKNNFKKSINHLITHGLII